MPFPLRAAQRRAFRFTISCALHGTVCVALGGCGRVGYSLTQTHGAGEGAAGEAPGTGASPDASAGAGGAGNGGSGGTLSSAGGTPGATGGDAGTAGGAPDGTGGSRSADASAGGAPGDAAVDAPSCGDGVVQAGEACDDRGPSPTCNADCTFSSCGDGKLDKASGETCDDADRLTACGATCAAVTCRAGCTCEWYFGHRYMLCPDKIVYTEAQKACIASGMRLVRLTSGQEHSYLRLRSQQGGYPKFHIGASDSAQEGKWIWDDGTQFWSGGSTGAPVGGRFAFWASGEPNNQNGDENCAEVQSIQGWNDSVCDFESKPFVCKQYRDPRVKCGNGLVDSGETCDDGKATTSCDADCSPVVCGDGTVNAAAGEVCDDGGSGQYCSNDCKQTVCPTGCQCFTAAGSDYALCKAAASFGDAEVFCGKHGMALADASSASEDQALRTQASTSGVTDYWLGGTDLDAEGQWRWMDTTAFWSGAAAGKALAYAHFAAMEPGGGNASNCLHVGADGQWTAASCATSFAYVCERLLP